MSHLQSHHSARDELRSESESYNQLSESLCYASNIGQEREFDP